jgi:hypothetical protein
LNPSATSILRGAAKAIPISTLFGLWTVSTPFDDALAAQALSDAADAYARRRGNPGTPEYREAWMRFRERIKTIADLRHLPGDGRLDENP